MRQAIHSKDLYHLLRDKHPANGHWPAETPWEMMLGSFLVQNTTWMNTKKSLNQLREATGFDPATIASLDKDTLIQLIYSSGFHQNKSQLIHYFFTWLGEYDFDLERIKQDLGTQEPLRERLLSFRGIGLETADVLLLYAFEEPAFIADNYARKLYRTLECPAADSYDHLKAFVEDSTTLTVPEWQQFHIQILDYGKRYLKGKPPYQEPLSEQYYIATPDSVE
ncbi:MAG: deoxyribonuclease I [Aerococcus sp.]|nr:deoxyribonuclease I [Aerococcus sp.]